jgi:hypothetical protein
VPDAPTASRRRAVAIDARLLIGIVLVIGSVAGVVAIVSAGDRRVSVYAAASSLSPGAVVQPEDLLVRQVSLDQSDDLYLAPGDLPDDGLVAITAIRVGELVPLSAVGSTQGNRSTSLVLALAGRVSAAVVSGALVDVWSAPSLTGEVGSVGAFGPPIVLTADAVVVRVVEDDGLASASDGDAVEVLVPRVRIARLLQAIANGDALAIVPAGIPLSDQ